MRKYDSVALAFLICSVFFISIFLQSCNVINPDEEVPAYINIDTIKLQTNVAAEGTASHKITDAWVYINGEFLGVFDLPALVPFFGSDSTEITIKPGIYNNGGSTTRASYPFYKPYVGKIFAKPLGKETINYTASYFPNTQFLCIENYDFGNNFQRDGGDTTLVTTTDPTIVFEGTRSLGFYLDTQYDDGIFTTINNFNPPNTLNEIYAELNYKCSNSFEIWFTYINSLGQVNSQYKRTISPRNDWNKIYLRLTDEFYLFQPSNFNITIKAKLDSDKSQSDVWIDNFKMMYY